MRFPSIDLHLISLAYIIPCAVSRVLELLLILAAIIMSQSPTPRSGDTSPRAGPYTIAEERSVPPVAPTLASQVQEALMLGHDVSMSVVVEQVEHVPVPETPPIASGVDTPVQVFWKYCVSCGSKPASLQQKFCGECGASLLTPDINRHNANMSDILAGSLLASPAGHPQRETAPAPAVPESASPQGQLSHALEVLGNLWQSRNESSHPFPVAPKSWDHASQSVSPSLLPLGDVPKTEDAMFEAACAESLRHPQPVPFGAVSDPPRGRTPVDSWCPPYEPPVARTALDVSHYQVERFGMDQPSNFSSGPTMPRPALPQVLTFQLIVRSLDG